MKKSINIIKSKIDELKNFKLIHFEENEPKKANINLDNIRWSSDNYKPSNDDCVRVMKEQIIKTLHK
jgi:hypothetical protein